MTAVRVRIDDKEIDAEPGTNVLQAASRAGVYIPHLCYDENLSIRGSCRVCLVEIEGNPKLQPACSTPVCDKMVVRTDTATVREARRGVLELLLVNHPLDCPVCDKGGECTLQDYVFHYGDGKGRFGFEKRTYAREDIGPFVMRDMNRCVHCTRCIRFASEIALTDDLGAFDRGDRTSIGTHLGRELRNPFSGNVTELCPVGALTDRVFRFKARVWELEDTPSACPLCPVGCLTFLQLDKGRIARVRGRQGGASPWICDLGRYGYAAARPRANQAVVREHGQETNVPCDVAFRTVGERLRVISKKNGPQSVGVFCSTSATNEEMFTIRHVFRNLLGSNNIDSRVRAAAPLDAEETRVLSHSLKNQGRAEELVDCDSILVFCSDPCEETPIAGLELVKAARLGAKMTSIGPRKPGPDVLSRTWLAATPEDSAFVLASVAREAVERSTATLFGVPDPAKTAGDPKGFSLGKASELTGIEPGRLSSLVDELLSSRRLGLVVGLEVFNGPFVYLVLSSMLRIWAARNALEARETVLLSLLGERNVRGALELGVFPARLNDERSASGGEGFLPGGERRTEGMSLGQMMEAARSGDLKALFVFGGDLLSECDDRKIAQEALANLEFLVVQDERIHETAGLAHVYLPLQEIFERKGSFLTLDGDLKALRPQTSQDGSRSHVFGMLDSLCRAMGARLNFGDADSAFREIKRLHGWDFDEDLEKLSHGRGVRFQSVQKTPEPTWTAEREFEKKMAVTMGSNTSGEPGGDDVSQNESYPYVLVSGTAGVSRWVWARGISGHKSIPGDVFVEVSEVDADGLEIAEGSVVDVESPRGSIRARVVTTRNMMRGVVFVPHGFAGASANLLGGTGGLSVRVRLKKTRV